MNELLKQVGHELGYQYINGKYEDGSDDSLLLDGILTQAAKDADVVKVKTVGTTMLQRLKELRTAIPVTMRNNPNLRILMSVEEPPNLAFLGFLTGIIRFMIYDL